MVESHSYYASRQYERFKDSNLTDIDPEFVDLQEN